jgi:tRNA pseudouridine32 synthase/23S rRNA pseudouridine746 synthase
MSRPTPPDLPLRDGVSASCVALPPGPWATVLDFIAERIPTVTREDWRQRMLGGEVVTASGQAVGPEGDYRSQARQDGRLFYWRSLPFEHPVPFEEAIVFQDELLVIADKPHFLPVTPKGRYLQETLLVRLKRRLGIATLVPMHRLDRETAGLVAFTVQPATRDAYQRLFRDKSVHKVYEAVAPLRPDLQWPLSRQSRLVESEHFMAMTEVEGQPNAETHIDLLSAHGGWGHYRLQPVTGQKHQLRVHMNALGLPIANDRIYPTLLPDTPEDEPPDHTQPLQLLARSLSFIDPITGQSRHFDSQRTLDLMANIVHAHNK